MYKNSKPDTCNLTVYSALHTTIIPLLLTNILAVYLREYAFYGDLKLLADSLLKELAF